MRSQISLAPLAYAIALTAAVLVGCQPSENANLPQSEGEHAGHQHEEGQHHGDPLDAGTPDAAVVTFLNAVRTGDEQTASTMLTTTARIEMPKADMHVQPPGSPNAQFHIGEVRLMPEHGGAHVDSNWTDIVDNGEERTYAITWILRQEQDSWRVAGMSTELYPNQPPLLLNFEDPADMQAQVQQANAEMVRQSALEGEVRQATIPPEAGNRPPR